MSVIAVRVSYLSVIVVTVYVIFFIS